MKCSVWMKPLGFSLVAVAVLAGMAWADPTGSANVFQFVEAFTNRGTSLQHTFHTGDELDIEAVYYDPNPACAGVSPVLAQLFIFDSVGLFQAVLPMSDFTTSLGPKYRVLFRAFPGLSVAPDTYHFTILVRNCTNTASIVLVPFLSIRVTSP